MEKKFNIVVVCDKVMLNYVVYDEPKIDDTFFAYGLEYKIIDIQKHITITDNNCSVAYMVCNCECITKVNENRVMVKQVKFFSEASIDKLQELVNNFLYENRHKYEIENINYNYYTCVIEYRLRKNSEIDKSIWNEKCIYLNRKMKDIF